MNGSRTLMMTLSALLIVTGCGQQAGSQTGGRTGPSEIKVGYRAFTMPVPEHQALNVRPGDFVDVMSTFDWKMGKEKQVRRITATLLQYVKVLAVAKDRKSLELMLNPNEAQYAALSVAPERGVWVIVRRDGDKEMEPREMADFEKLFR
ncbi:MAG: hypothetical protein HYZ75_05490 [Elusimicrobia bacterium]|nr:hypothetical protein [Elusimicrobiota bacterium]